MISIMGVAYTIAQLFQQGGNSGGAGGEVAGQSGGIIGSIVIPGLLIMGVFTKAGKPWWAAFVPIYNAIVLLDIIGRPTWWIILYIIPLVDLIVWIVVCIDLAKSFGKDTLYGIGLIVPFLNFILILMLSYGSAQYVGPAAKSGGSLM